MTLQDYGAVSPEPSFIAACAAESARQCVRGAVRARVTIARVTYGVGNYVNVQAKSDQEETADMQATETKLTEIGEDFWKTKRTEDEASPEPMVELNEDAYESCEEGESASSSRGSSQKGRRDEGLGPSSDASIP